MSEELRKSYHEELDSIRDGIVRMAGRVTESIPRGTEVFLAGDLNEAQQVIEDDDVLDAMSVELEERCYQVLALQQPMASDLRAITTALWMNAEIERSGDLMVNIAKATRRIYGIEIDPRIRGLVVQMSEEAGRLFRLAIDSYAEGDSGLGAALRDIDDRLDELHRETIQAIFETSQERQYDLQAGVQLALVCRFYERIGDHAVNIGERVCYMVDGWHPEHTGALRANARKLNEFGAGDGGVLDVTED
ncbi:MAG: phosphate signaling complex protein PhoU [Acidimicrobiales bacterium]